MSIRGNPDGITNPGDLDEVDPEVESPESSVQGNDGNAKDSDISEVSDISDVDALEAVKQELSDMKEQFLRAKAEAENIRRRSELEITKARKYAVENFAAELLSVKDSLDLAANVDLSNNEDDVVNSMHEGLELTLRQLDNVFEKFGITALEPQTGDKLNPELHQAMTVQVSAEMPPNHIVKVIQKGFSLNDRLLRPAMVIVAKAPS
ncbi:MAG: hypothetical protein DHS20C01_04610 [marine bacterium B5-7]|nr:MAG: hypothetical protein DHS20C01_04610 [marine bacterium B5-7]